KITSAKTAFVTHPMSLFVSGAQIGIEHIYAKSKSIRITAALHVKEDGLIYNGSYEGIKFELQNRFYLPGEKFRGNFNDLYLAPYLYYKQIQTRDFVNRREL